VGGQHTGVVVIMVIGTSPKREELVERERQI